MDDVVVREARGAEVGQAIAVADRAFASVRQVYRPRRDVAAHEAQRASLGTRLVALCGAGIVGTLQFEVHAEHVHVIGLAVAPEHQGRGVARRLLAALEARAPALGRSVLALDTIRETGNVARFEALGFRTISEAPTDLFESDTFERLHEVKMERAVARTDRRD